MTYTIVTFHEGVGHTGSFVNLLPFETLELWTPNYGTMMSNAAFVEYFNFLNRVVSQTL